MDIRELTSYRKLLVPNISQLMASHFMAMSIEIDTGKLGYFTHKKKVKTNVTPFHCERESEIKRALLKISLRAVDGVC